MLCQPNQNSADSLAGLPEEDGPISKEGSWSSPGIPDSFSRAARLSLQQENNLAPHNF